MAGVFQPDVFQPDVFQVEAGIQFTADAILLSTISATFTADSVIVTTVSSSFTADAYLIATVSGSFTANSTLLKAVSSSFTADSILVNKLIEDDFNRTTTQPSIGQPSVIGHYDNIQFYDDSSTNGSYLEVADNFGALGIHFGKSSSRIWVRFDYRITEADGFGGYELYGGAGIPNSNFWRTMVRIFEDEGGVWNLWTAGDDDLYIFNPTPGDWWTVKAWLDTRTGGSMGAKTWKVGDPEPADWQNFNTDTQFWDFVFTPALIDSTLFAYSGETESAGIDNLLIQQIGGGWTQDFFNADAVLVLPPNPQFNADAVLKRTESRLFTADAVISPGAGFTANAVILKTVAATFTANAAISNLIPASITADAVIVSQPLLSAFTANAVIIRASVSQPAPTSYRKTQTLAVFNRRDRPLPAFIPPRSPTTPDEDDTIIGTGTGPCLPPCEGVNAGPYSEWGVNGAAIRRTIFYCANCDAQFVYSDENQLGRDGGTTSGHDCCQTSHSKGDHIYRMWTEYSSLPSTSFQMKAKLKWEQLSGYPTTVRIKVYGNIAGLPDVTSGNCMLYTPTNWLEMWNAGDYLGDLTFYKTGGSGGYYWDDVPEALVIERGRITTNVFRFQLSDEVNVIRPEFRAGNIEIV